MKRLLAAAILSSSLLTAQSPSDRVIRYKPEDWVTFPESRFVTALALGQDHVYFGTTGGILSYNFFQNQWGLPFTYSDGLESDYILQLNYDFNSGVLWALTRAGLSYREPASLEWRSIPAAQTGLTGLSAIGSGTQYVWLAGNEGLRKGDRFGVFFHEAERGEMEEDQVTWNGGRDMETLPDLFPEGNLFFSMDGYLQRPDFRKYEITRRVQDDYQNLWMGTWGLGAAIGDLKTLSLKVHAFGPLGDDLQALAWDGDGMWMGGRSHGAEESGVTYWDMRTGEWRYFQARYTSGFTSDEMTALAMDGRYVWFGTKQGLTRYQPAKESWRTFTVHSNLMNDEITSLAVMDSELWVGTASGINRVKSGSVIHQVRAKGLVNRVIHHLEPDGDDLWAATDRGLFFYDSQKKTWSFESGAANLLANEAFAVSAYAGQVWVATDDGVQVLDKSTGEWEGFPKAHFPTGDRVYNILADDDIVWFGTSNGLLKYSKSDNRWHRFTREDGLRHPHVYWILLDGDYLWLATGRGLTRFLWNAPYRVD